jgi:hypothetical protein
MRDEQTLSKVPRLKAPKTTLEQLFPELPPSICLSRYITSVSELYGRRLYNLML